MGGVAVGLANRDLETGSGGGPAGLVFGRGSVPSFATGGLEKDTSLCLSCPATGVLPVFTPVGLHDQGFSLAGGFGERFCGSPCADRRCFRRAAAAARNV